MCTLAIISCLLEFKKFPRWPESNSIEISLSIRSYIHEGIDLKKTSLLSEEQLVPNIQTEFFFFFYVPSVLEILGLFTTIWDLFFIPLLNSFSWFLFLIPSSVDGQYKWIKEDIRTMLKTCIIFSDQLEMVAGERAVHATEVKLVQYS